MHQLRPPVREGHPGAQKLLQFESAENMSREIIRARQVSTQKGKSGRKREQRQQNKGCTLPKMGNHAAIITDPPKRAQSLVQ